MCAIPAQLTNTSTCPLEFTASCSASFTVSELTSAETTCTFYNKECYQYSVTGGNTGKAWEITCVGSTCRHITVKDVKKYVWDTSPAVSPLESTPLVPFLQSATSPGEDHEYMVEIATKTKESCLITLLRLATTGSA